MSSKKWDAELLTRSGLMPVLGKRTVAIANMGPTTLKRSSMIYRLAYVYTHRNSHRLVWKTDWKKKKNHSVNTDRSFSMVYVEGNRMSFIDFHQLLMINIQYQPSWFKATLLLSSTKSGYVGRNMQRTWGFVFKLQTFHHQFSRNRQWLSSQLQLKYQTQWSEHQGNQQPEIW